MSFLFNPFHKIAGAKALFMGLVFAIITLIIAPFSYSAFDSALGFHKAQFENWWSYTAVNCISWISLVFVYCIAAILFSKTKFRLVDIVGTTLLARAPLLIIAIIAFYLPELHKEDIQHLDEFHLSFIAIIALISIVLCTIWMVALLFNAYRVSLNIKGNKAIWTFILTLLCAEILSTFITYYSLTFLN